MTPLAWILLTTIGLTLVFAVMCLVYGMIEKINAVVENKESDDQIEQEWPKVTEHEVIEALARRELEMGEIDPSLN